MDLQEVVLTPVRDLGTFIREQREAAQISVRQLAKRAGVSNPYLSQVERGLRKPSAEMLAQIAHGLQISVETLLTKAGILDPGAEPTPVVIDAIRADPALTDGQKASMLEIYQAFRRDAVPTVLTAPSAIVTDAAVPAEAADTALPEQPSTERKDDVVRH